MEKVIRYLVDLNKCRIGLLQQSDGIVGQPPRQDPSHESALMPPRAMGQEALDFLKDFSPPDCTPCFDISAVDQETFKGILQGTNFTAAVVKWFASCRWPPKVSKDYARKDDWGISWLELLFSFILFSRCHILGLQCSRGTFVACVNSCCFPDLFHVSAGHQNHHFGGHHPYHLFQPKSARLSVISVFLVPLRASHVGRVCQTLPRRVKRSLITFLAWVGLTPFISP